MFCSEQTMISANHYGALATAIKCRSWTCPNCAEMRRLQLVAIAFSGNANRFITITCRRGQYPTPNLAAAALAKAWRAVVAKWRRQHPRAESEYLAIFEAHKSGWPHLHILWRGAFIQWTWLRNEMATRLNSPGVWIEYLSKSKQRASYVTKYCGKASHRFGTSKRYWTSKSWRKEPTTAAVKVFPRTVQLERRNIRLPDLLREWHRHGHLVWTIRPHIYGWGDPWWVPPHPPRPPLTRLVVDQHAIIPILQIDPEYVARAT